MPCVERICVMQGPHGRVRARLLATCFAGDRAGGRVRLRACGRVQASDQVLQTRIVHLPVAFNDKWTNDAIAKYMKSVRPAAERMHPPGLAQSATNRQRFPLGHLTQACLLWKRERPLNMSCAELERWQAGPLG
jgi:hypothetical protein